MLESMNANDNKPLAGYAEINAAWGCNPKTLRKLTDAEALRAAKLILREGFKAFGDGKKATGFKFVIAPRCNCYTWPHGNRFYVNPNRCGEGIAEIVHDISHYVHRRCHPKKRGHEFHAVVELHLVEWTMKNNLHI